LVDRSNSVGYGTAKRKDLTNAVASIDESSFNKGQTTDFQQLLQSRVPGVQISASNGDLGAEPLIRIRGGTSISAANGPMIVIDGVPVGGNSSTPNFDPDNTDTGGEAGSDGPSGGYRENPLASLNPYDIQSIDILKDASAAAIYGARAGNGVILITTKSGQSGGSTLNYDVYTSLGSQSSKYDLLDASEYNSYVNSSAVQTVLTRDTLELSNVGSANTDWQDAVSRTAVSQSHNLSFSSGNDNTSYLISMNYLDEEGIILGSDRQRISGRLNVAHKALDNKLKLNLRLNPSYIKRNNTPYRQTGGFRGGLFTNVLKYNPTLPVTNADGSFFEYPGSPDIRNPVAMAELIDDESTNMRIFANAAAEYEFIPGLSGKINLGLDRSNGERGIFQPNALPYAAAFGGRADLRTNDAQSTLLETTLNYNKQLQGNNELSVWAGYTFQEFESSFVSAAAEGFVTDFTSFNSLIGGQSALNPRSFAEGSRLVSFLSRVIYNMDSKYIINAALRREGSSRFGDNNKWGLFPSASVAWRLSEDLFKGSNTIDDLKLRLSYGITGNQDIGNYLSLILLEPGSNAVIGGQNQVGFAQQQLANPDLKWEETSQINLGMDFGILDNKI
ncbi:MAG: SusC/RagA family TonB-linked outer membrane protein, partial [Calditrichota bacterium]